MDDDVLVTRILEVLADRTGWTYDPTGTVPYPPDGVGLYYGPVGALTDRGVGVALYGTDDVLMLDGPDVAPSPRRVQLRIRGGRNDPAGADRLASQAFRALHGLSRVSGLNHAARLSVAQLGVDDNNRPERADNYTVTPDTEA